VWGPTCVVGGTVKITVTTDFAVIPFLPYVHQVLPTHPPVRGTAEMRVERCP
jgi:hypothetical protein